VTFMALTCGEQPDHSTIAGFVSSMKEEIKLIFRDVLLVCEEEVSGRDVFYARWLQACIQCFQGVEWDPKGSEEEEGEDREEGEAIG